MRALVLVVMISLCAAAARADEDGWFKWREPTWQETAVLVAADVMIAVDVMQSLDIQNHQLHMESNPFLGFHPSEAKIIVVGALGSITAMTAVWYAMPSRWRVLLPAVVLGVETGVVINNHQAGLRIQF